MTNTTKFLLLGLIIFALTVGNAVFAQETSLEAMEEVNLDEDVQSSDLEVGEPKVLPDHPFYFLKNWARKIRSFFAFNPRVKAELNSRFANERLMELKEMIRKNKNPEAINKAVEGYQNEVEKTKKFAEKIKEKAQENEEVGKFLDKFIRHQALHQSLLQKLEEQVPAEVFEKIKTAREIHLERFNDMMLKLEDKDKIPERLEKNLQMLKGSKFKEFKNLELVNDLMEKLPEDVKQKMEEKKEQILERLRERLEELPPEEQEKFKEYLDKISGDKLKHLDIITALEGKEFSEKLKKVIKEAKERNVEKIENKYSLVKNPEELAENQIKQAENLLEKAENLIIEKDINKEEMPAVFRLVEEAEEKLESVEKYFEEENLGRAFGQATVSTSLSKNAIRIIEMRLGFTDDENGNSICANINLPVCGEDGKTYNNICEAKKAGVKIAHRERCRVKLSCAKEGERVNRNPLLGSVNQVCCGDLKEVRVNRTYSVCKKLSSSFECEKDEDCPLPRCPGVSSTCVNGKCAIPRCLKPTICIQVITPAKNPETGECKEFPTPCDVPEGWIKVNACPTSLRQRIESKIKQ